MDVVILFGKNVRALRDEADLSQEELAFRAGMKRGYLSDLERGTRNPTVRCLGRLAKALNVPPGRLLE
ncbi:helix-turn-helix transcriptional regulator [Brevundimonas sp. WCHBH090558]|uniref:helix-turn-helix domain-containing protein n=1 Tax=Brevundimonas TaxID=41275 RepID=UPI000EC8D1D6|nr:helix-turn-helix transcriptional regulator [Brevundimonas huaxiensis]MBC1181877.1 helix-turn-helix transcriptional regulator [Brevundimonas huaxiensis]HAL05856.1 transcriptional regulator [Brevundimonas sp.]